MARHRVDLMDPKHSAKDDEYQGKHRAPADDSELRRIADPVQSYYTAKGTDYIERMRTHEG